MSITQRFKKLLYMFTIPLGLIFGGQTDEHNRFIPIVFDELVVIVPFQEHDNTWNDPYFIDTKLFANTSSFSMSE